MADLISREAALELGYWHGKRPDIGNPYGDGVDAVDTVDIEALPAVDAVEVVRCKDCEHWDGFCYCNCHAADGNGSPIFMRYYDFCSYGERREENAEP